MGKGKSALKKQFTYFAERVVVGSALWTGWSCNQKGRSWCWRRTGICEWKQERRQGLAHPAHVGSTIDPLQYPFSPQKDNFPVVFSVLPAAFSWLKPVVEGNMVTVLVVHWQAMAWVCISKWHWVTRAGWETEEKKPFNRKIWKILFFFQYPLKEAVFSERVRRKQAMLI